MMYLDCDVSEVRRVRGFAGSAHFAIYVDPLGPSKAKKGREKTQQ